LIDPVSVALIVSAFIIVMGFLANYLFKRTGLPDMLILIFLGAIFGPILRVFDPTAVQRFAPYIAALALAYILFDGGMGLSIKKVISQSPRALLLALLGFVFSMLGTATFMVLVFDMPLLYGLLFGSICGGSSSVVVISLASKIKISDKGSTTLILESAVTDILCIVVSLAFIGVLANGQTNVLGIGEGIIGKFLIGAGIGIVIGFSWLFALRKVAAMPFSYILTLATVLFSYAVSEIIGGSGALSALLFGLILGNEKEILNFLNLQDNENGKISLMVSRGLKRFESEFAFLIRTFFFAFLGMIASFSSWTLLLSGIGLSVILFAVRYGAVWLSTMKTALQKERQIMTVILTRGLAAAVLATLPAEYGLQYSDLFINIGVVIIIATAIIATVGTMIIARQQAGNGKPLHFLTRRK
jgi:cell volume regulation protein A